MTWPNCIIVYRANSSIEGPKFVNQAEVLSGLKRAYELCEQNFFAQKKNI